MRPGVGSRAALGLFTAAASSALLAPRTPPRVDLIDPAARAAEVVEFGLRMMATVLAGYLAVVFLGFFLMAVRWLPSSIRAPVDRWTTRGLAGGLRRCVGLSALAMGVLPLQPLAAHATEPGPVLAPDDSAPPPSPAPHLVPMAPVGPGPTPPGTPVADPPTAVPEPPAPEPPAPEPADSGSLAPAAPEPAVRQVTVGPGDSFWTVAERLTSSRLGRPAGDAEVLEPWLALIAANRDRLTDPEDPDLLFPGQVLRLPE